MTVAVRPFAALSAPARAALHAWRPGTHADVASLEAHAGSLIFEDARTFLTAWRGDEPVGTLGVVVREIAPKGLCYLTSAQAEDAEALQALVAAARALVPPGHAPELRLATGPDGAHVGKFSTTLGFAPGARTLELARPLAPALPAGPALALHPLTPERFAAYLEVSNAAFHDTPSGATLGAADLALMRDAQPEPAFLGVGYADDGRPVAAWSLALAGQDGVIEALAVAPAHQGRGYGRALLAHARDVLAAAGAARLVLTVGDGNVGALALYRKSGFADERVVTQWHVRGFPDP